jgi:hypothetical protein
MIDMNRTVHILLAEDDLIDEKAFLRAIEKLRITNPVTVARDGMEAWEILKGTNSKPPLPRPDLIVLDINMPRMNGSDFPGSGTMPSFTTDRADHVERRGGQDRGLQPECCRLYAEVGRGEQLREGRGAGGQLLAGR